MVRPKTDKDLKKFADDLSFIADKVDTFGHLIYDEKKGLAIKETIKRNLRCEMSDEDVSRLIHFTANDSFNRHSTGVDTLKTTKMDDLKRSEFVKMATILTLDDFSSTTKDKIQELIEVNHKVPYSTVIKEATVLGAFKGLDADADAVLQTALDKKLETQKCIVKVCEESNQPEAVKEVVEDCGARMAFNAKVNESGISKLTQAFLNITGNVFECDSDELKESFMDRASRFIQDSFSYPNDSKTGDFFKSLVEFNEAVHKLEVDRQYQMKLEEDSGMAFA